MLFREKMQYLDSLDASTVMTKSEFYENEYDPPLGDWRRNGAVAYRHNGKTNVLFFDAHSGPVAREVVDESNYTNIDAIQRVWLYFRQ